MDDRILQIYDHYVHSSEPRREFLRKLAGAAGTMAAAAAILPLLEGTGAEAAIVPESDPRVMTTTARFGDGATAEMTAYVAMPAAAGKYPAIVVIHENRGLSTHVRDICRRLATAGFLAIAPDLLSPLGGTPTDRDKAREMQRTLTRQDIVRNLVATSRFAASHSNSIGAVGAIGFCWGGDRANALAIADPTLKAAVAYYGVQPKTDIDKIRAKLMLHYAGDDPRVNAGIENYMNALKAAGKSVEMFQYPGTRHAFNNDTSPARYVKAAAELSWARTIAFFKANVK